MAYISDPHGPMLEDLVPMSNAQADYLRDIAAAEHRAWDAFDAAIARGLSERVAAQLADAAFWSA